MEFFYIGAAGAGSSAITRHAADPADPILVRIRQCRRDKDDPGRVTVNMAPGQPYELTHIFWTSSDALGLSGFPYASADLVSVCRPHTTCFDELIRGLLCDLAHRLAVPPGSLPSIANAHRRGLRSLFSVHQSTGRLAADVEAIVTALIGIAPRRTT